MNRLERMRDQLAEIVDPDITVEEGFGPPTFDVPSLFWVDALDVARNLFGYHYFDWLSAVDELDEGFSVLCHLAAIGTHGTPGRVDHVLFRTRVPRERPRLRSATGVFAGARWHERETHEMFGIEFDGHPGLTPLLLPEEFEGHPLRKEFVLAARVAKAWPGAKEPGESDATTHRAPSRRRVVPPGVPSAEEWGPRPPADDAEPAADGPDAEGRESASRRSGGQETDARSDDHRGPDDTGAGRGDG